MDNTHRILNKLPRFGDGVVNSSQVQSAVNKEGDNIVVVGNVLALGLGPMTIHWRAPAPSTKGHSFSGSGFPHPNSEQAFDVRSFSGVIKSRAGEFKIVLNDMPGAYYSGLGSIYIPPHIELIATNNVGKAWSGTVLVRDYDVPYRWISGAPPGIPPPSEGEGRAMFFLRDPDGGVRSQESILRSRGFPQ